MKSATMLTTVLVVSLVAGFATLAAVAQEVTGTATETVEFDVYGMTSTGCSAAIEDAVNDLEGIRSVEADHREGRARVEFDPTRVTVEAIEECIEELGYGAELRTEG